MQNRAPGVDTVLLNSILVVGNPSHCVTVILSNCGLYNYTVRRTRCVYAFCGLISTTMRPYVTVLSLGTLPLGMKKMVFFPFGMRVTNPWASLPRSLMNYFIHISLSVPPCNCFYSYYIPEMGLITVLASKWLHASCDVRICLFRAYIEALWSVLICWRHWDHHDDAAVGWCDTFFCTLGGGAVMVPVNGTLGDGAVLVPGNVTPGSGDVVGAIVGRYVASIFCRFLIAWNWSSLIDNEVSGFVFLRASIKSSNYWHELSAGYSFGNGKSCGKNYNVLIILSACVAGT